MYYFLKILQYDAADQAFPIQRKKYGKMKIIYIGKKIIRFFFLSKLQV